ncbi:CD44 antigen isoform X17 [Heterocephalus glaber]|uniref:CD44 antigen n=1 Tax=Heterocephalus glaber TaxID=10181 RepID=A0AAX6R1P9_HETGA|nr:CD44 antigen isoform X17 [Heterocephalus glaber]
MDKFWWRAAWGLCLLQLSLAQVHIDLNITCRYAGVFHVEKNGRYSISRTEAADLCKAFNTTLPTMAQMELALSKGFETCRYGFIEGHVVIPRINPNAICAANNTGVYILPSNTSHYDTYCFNASAPLDEEDCTSVTDLPNSFEGQVTISIVNRDGTRYTKKGEYRTNPEDINPINPLDEDVSSGSSSERSTLGGYSIFHTHLPTTHPTSDLANTGVYGSTSTDSNTMSKGWAPSEENEEDIDIHLSFSGSGIDDDEDFISSTISTTPRVSDHTKQFQDWIQWKPSHSNTEVLLQTTTRMTDVDRNGTSVHGEDWTQDAQPPVIHHEHQDSEETPHSTSTTWAAPSSTTEETATQKEQWFEREWHGEYPQTPREDSDSTTGTTGDQDTFIDPNERSHTTSDSKSDGHSSGTRAGASTPSPPQRRPQIPEWLIILASLLALALILAVCIAVNSRRRCGQKKKLVINNGNGAVEDRKPSGLNGEASKSQEMVHLVNKEPSETPDQFMTADETRNLQNVDMKIGV